MPKTNAELYVELLEKLDEETGDKKKCEEELDEMHRSSRKIYLFPDGSTMEYTKGAARRDQFKVVAVAPISAT